MILSTSTPEFAYHPIYSDADIPERFRSKYTKSIYEYSALDITRSAVARALLECAEIMENTGVDFFKAREKLFYTNPYFLGPNKYFSYLRYTGTETLPYATHQQQIDAILLIREHVIQTGLIAAMGDLLA